MNHTNRNASIGGSDAMRIMAGDWHTLWLEKTGRAGAANLDDVFAVQLGRATETFHGHWFGKVTGKTVQHSAVTVVGKESWLTGNIDFWIREENTFLEVKHSNANATLRDKALYYMPQIAHYCLVTGRDYGWFSVIPGNDDPVYGKVEPDRAYIEQLEQAERLFWWHVTMDSEPDNIPKRKLMQVAEESPLINKINGQRAYDFATHNQWCNAANDYLANKEAAARFEAAKKDLKAMVPEDAAEVYGAGLMIRRSKSGSLLFKELEAA